MPSFVASCDLVKSDPFEWFRDVFSRIAVHAIQKLVELLPEGAVLSFQSSCMGT